jgi:glycosyltransferase involved in cell wall biosynthesis
MPSQKKRLAVLLNVIAPYRLPILSVLADNFDTLVLHGGSEPNRTWTVDLPQNIKSRRVFTLQIPLRKMSGVAGITDTTYLHLNLGLIWWLLRFKPQVILSNEMGLRTIIAILYGKLARVPVWVWWGGTLHSERNITTARGLLRRLLVKSISRWLSYGASTTEYLESIGVTREHILQIQNCVPQEVFQVAPSKPSDRLKDARRPVILTVGQFLQRKGFDKLIEACGRLARRGVSFSLVLVGQGPELNRLQALAEENQIEHFQILPNQPQPLLNEIYRSADAFVFPTLEDVWGLVVNEAMWAGVPVLCSKYAGCAEELLPASQIFDPLSAESFDNALAVVIKRSVRPSDCSTLLPWQEVATMISRSLDAGEPVSEGLHLDAQRNSHSCPRTNLTELDLSIDPKSEITT